MTDDLISRLMADLKSEWQEEVQSAMHALASLGDSVVLPLLDAIEGRDPVLRRQAALVLEQLQPQEALPPLVELLTGEEIPPDSKPILVRILVDLLEDDQNDPQMLALLTQLSTDNDPEIRLLSTQGLGKCNSLGSNVELCRLAQDSDEAVRTEAQQLLTQRARQKKENGIQPLEPSMLEAAARLRVRSGLSPNRRDAISELLAEGEDAARDLLPFLGDAGTKTLQEVTPLLKQIKDAKAHVPLIDIVLQKGPWQRRQMALRSLNNLKRGDPFLMELYRKLLKDTTEMLRIEALTNIAASEAQEKLELLLEALRDEHPKVRAQSAELLFSLLGPHDKERIRPILETLQRFPHEESREHLLKGLAHILVGAPGDQLFIPDILDLLDPSEPDSCAVVLGVLDKIVPRQPSIQISRSLLALLGTLSASSLVEQVLALLVRVLPRNHADATPALLPHLKRQNSVPIHSFVLRLLARVANQEAVETLISYATGQQSEVSPPLQQLAKQLLDNLEGTLWNVWQENGQYYSQPGLVCRCGERLQWVPTERGEELRCSACNEEYILTPPFVLTPIKEMSTPLCFCPMCPRKQPLVISEDKLPYCPHSGLAYVIRSDTGTPQIVEQLEFGLCECCNPPQPLDLRGEEIVCIRTGKRPRDTQEHNTLALNDTAETPMPSFSVNDTSNKQRTTASHRAARPGRTTRPSINSPTTLTHIRSYQLRQALLADPEQTADQTEAETEAVTAKQSTDD